VSGPLARPRAALAGVAAFGALAVAGAFTFDEHTRSDPGTEVTLLPVAVSDGELAADWLRTSDAASVVGSDGGLRVESADAVVAAASRTVTLAAERCYGLELEVDDVRGATTVGVTGERLHPSLLEAPVPAGGAPGVMTAAFRTPGNARVAVVLRQEAGAGLTLGAVRIAPLPEERCGGADG